MTRMCEQRKEVLMETNEDLRTLEERISVAVAVAVAVRVCESWRAAGLARNAPNSTTLLKLFSCNCDVAFGYRARVFGEA